MKIVAPFSPLVNGSRISWSEIPSFAITELVQTTSDLLDKGARLCSWFVLTEGQDHSIVCVLAMDTESLLAIARSEPVQGSYPSLTPRHPQAHLFEREVWEQSGLVPQNHPWLKPVRYILDQAPANAPFFQVDGPEVHEVAVGPVHAGVIEPGHFRFQCRGEEVLHLEISLGYQHRGIEKHLKGGPHPLTVFQMETIAGDTSIAHATAYATNMEALSGVEAPLRAQWLRALALELERLANHTGDMGALALDVAFLPTSAACGKIRGDFLNLTALVCGNRFGRGLIFPGGCRHDLEPSRLGTLLKKLREHIADAQEAIAWFWDAASVRIRFRDVGVVHTSQARDIGLVGPSARACGLVRDVRFDHPAGWHRFSQAPVAVWPSGDILARAKVRTLEIERSGDYLLEQIKNEVPGPISTTLSSPMPHSLAVTLVEGWRGEVCHVAITDHNGLLRAYKITDPSFHNWTGLALALRGTAVYDFPICNKSFNLSYCGFDL